MINVKMPAQLNPTLSDVIHAWVQGTISEHTYESDPRIALLRALIHRSDLDADEVRELFFAVYPFESDNFYYNILEYELG